MDQRPPSSNPPADAESPPGPADSEKGLVRLQRALAQAGVGSRRYCEELIRQGRVEVDQQVVTELGTKVDPRRQTLAVDGRTLRRGRLEYFMLNKPVGVLSTNRDPAGRTRAIDLIPVTGHIYTIGRLDRSSEGLILITNDGDLANELTHPRFGVEKTYSVRVAGQPTFDQLKPLTSGIRLADGVARAARVSVKKRRPHATDLEIVLREGRNREIRRVLAAIGHKVLALRRIAVGTLRLADLPSGAHRRLTADEVEALRVSVREGPGRPETSRRSRSPAPRPRVSVRESSNRSEAGRARTASRAPLPGKGTRRRKRLGGKSSSPPRRPAKQGEPAPSSRSRSAAGRRPRRGDVPGGGRPPKRPRRR